MISIESYFKNKNYTQKDVKFFDFLHNETHYDRETEEASSNRWSNIKKLEDDDGFVAHQFNDFCRRYNFKSEEAVRDYLSQVKTVAEIGAGEGRAVDWYLEYSDAIIFALEISDSVYYLNEKYKNEPRVIVVKADALKHPFNDEKIDLLSCEQSIHHAPNPNDIFYSLCQSLSTEGRVLLSVFTEKAPIREKFDLLIRDRISVLEDSEKQEIAKKITSIGKILSDINVDIDIPTSFTEFGNLAGQRIELQRLFYYSVFKCFWNSDYSLEKNIEINFDWYNYPVCSKTSLSEAVSWFMKSELIIEHVDANDSNINIRGYKKS